MNTLFLDELKQLLIKYNASISFTCGADSDTYGLYDDRLELIVGKNVVFKSNGWSIDQSDL